MGRSKESWFEEMAHEYSHSRGEKFVCSGCVNDPFLEAKLDEAAEEEACSFCGTVPAADLVVLLDEIDAYLKTEYEDPVHSLMYISREGGYQGTVDPGDDLICDLLYPWFDSEEALEAVASAFADSYWCERDYARLKYDEKLRYGWERFSDEVKHHTRYRFFRRTPEEGDCNDELPPEEMLDELGTLLNRLDLYDVIPTGSAIFRARVADDELPCTAEELGPPPKGIGMRSNRMSAAGIPMFYGAFDKKTAVLETLDPKIEKGKVITIGTFGTNRDLLTVDLTDLPPFPSPFDRAERHLSRPRAFLGDFTKEFSRPVERDGHEHVEYVPTQVVSEFLRYRHRGTDDRPIDGVIYNSAKEGGGKAVVLFVEAEQCGPRMEKQVHRPEVLTLRCCEARSVLNGGGGGTRDGDATICSRSSTTPTPAAEPSSPPSSPSSTGTTSSATPPSGTPSSTGSSTTPIASLSRAAP